MRSAKFLTAAAIAGCLFATGALAQKTGAQKTGAQNTSTQDTGAQTASGAEHQCGTVSVTQMNWATAAITAEVAKFLLEQGYGCKIAFVKSATIPAITSIAQNGTPDVVTNLWLNSAGDAYDKLKKAGTIKNLTDVLKPGGIQGWWIPTYLAKEHPELKTIEGVLKHPEWVGGMFNNCPDGWACRTINDNLVRALKLKDSGIKIFDHGSGQTLASSMGAAVADHKPWFGYYWKPTAAMGKYHMTRVKIGEYSKAAFDTLIKPDAPDPEVSDYPFGEVITLVTGKFAKSHPGETAFLSKMSFETDMMSELLAWQEANHATAEKAAAHFLSTKQAIWSNWISASAKEKLSKLLKHKD